MPILEFARWVADYQELSEEEKGAGEGYGS